ncbi:unnamed protein product [Didymodactylos carnosus]|uniref:NmrA-like domain-containing protein n=1 Tax=Didymodactylos carnosus TaxID=1234261 RepID=A0A814W764_9BILA|nr:unnamed protein product [Didymodactylos carnosus]CAF1197467.1 unnamed protein product [Didymodactylos carnosus]CAF3961890.1 unnamed protein product [Didymodactylos carnosus]CAF3989101.1 unnamed protein product [Didymodactylos carnosus]
MDWMSGKLNELSTLSSKVLNEKSQKVRRSIDEIYKPNRQESIIQEPIMQQSVIPESIIPESIIEQPVIPDNLVLVALARSGTSLCLINLLLTNNQLSIRALVRSKEAASKLKEKYRDQFDIVIADFLDPTKLNEAMKHVKSVFHNGPPLHPKEYDMAVAMIDAAQKNDVEHFVYCSVAHPQLEQMITHQVKSRIEQYLIESKLNYTILQPMPFFENNNLKQIIHQQCLYLPYSPDIRMSWVSRDDVAEVVAKVLWEKDKHFRATYELCGPDHISYRDVVQLVSKQTGKLIDIQQISIEEAFKDFPVDEECKNKDYTILAFHRRFNYYNRVGLTGNSNILSWLLERRPTNWIDYILASS